MMLLPPSPGTCPICATAHAPSDPHNAGSIYYAYRFYGTRGRWPTWADAVAHCDTDMQRYWREELTKRGAWTEPPDGVEPVADPPGESFHQAIGDPNRADFGGED